MERDLVEYLVVVRLTNSDKTLRYVFGASQDPLIAYKEAKRVFEHNRFKIVEFTHNKTHTPTKKDGVVVSPLISD